MLMTLAAVVAVVAAIRSTWSPCGLSMLSTVTPMAEQGRGHRFGTTATWFTLGSVAGGATLGGVALVLAAAIGSADLSVDATFALAGVVALAGALVDSGLAGRRPPFLRRQLDDAWLARYRGWVYGAGFGWQIGVGFSTYIMTTAVALTVALGALTGDPAQTFGACVLFGLVRGLAVWASVRASTPAGLARLHRRFEAWEAPVRIGTAAAMALVAIVALASVHPLVGALAAALVGVAAVLGTRTRRGALSTAGAQPG